MSGYQIDFSEPLRPGFTIPAGGLNGPGGSAANSTLRLYGRGAIEWGEAVDEDLLRLSENFAAASPPINANSGQLWVETKLYYHEKGAPANLYWYRWNFSTSTWDTLPGVASSQPATPSIGQYYVGTGVYDNVNYPANTLWGYYSLGKYEPARWLPRSYMEDVGAPGELAYDLLPTQTLRIRDNNANNGNGAWTVPTITSSSEDPPANPQTGMFWYQPSTGILRVYSSNTSAVGLTRWHDVLGPSLGSTATVSKGNIDMGSYSISNLNLTPTGPSYATSKQYVDSTLSAGLSNKVSKTGDTMSGALVVNSSITSSSLNVSGTSILSGVVTASTGLNVSSGVLNMANNRIVNLALPTTGSDAANKQYVDNAVSGGAVDISGKYDKTGGPISGSVSITGTLTVAGATTISASVVLNGGTSQVFLPNAPTQPAHATNKAYVDNAVLLGAGAPPGAIVAYAGGSVPAGWLACEGQSVARDGMYANLFAAIGTLYGSTSSTTFNVPDLRGQFIRGWSNGGPVDPGRSLGSAQGSSVEKHKHLSMGEAYGGWPFGQSTVGGQRGSSGNIDNDNTYYFTNDGGDGVGATAGVTPNWNRAGLMTTETRPVNVAMRYIIKY